MDRNTGHTREIGISPVALLAEGVDRNCLCGRCSRKLRSAAARRVGMGSTCCRKETGKTITQLLKELDEQEAAAAAEQQEPDTQA